jgi:adenylate cyclase
MSRETVETVAGLSSKALNRVKNIMLSANVVSNAIGVGVVFFLSRGAPAKVESISRTVSWVFVPMAFVVPWIITRFYERPVRQYWDAVFRKETVSKEKADQSLRRLLNEPYFVIAVDMGVWLTAAGVYALVFRLFRVDWPLVRHAFTLCIITGLITSTVAFFVLEFHLERRLIPYAFPNGGLYLTPGVLRIGIRTRLLALFFASNLIPLLVILQDSLRLTAIPRPATEQLQVTLSAEAVVFVGVGIWLTFLVSSNLTRPLQEIIRVLGNVRRGMFDQKVQVTTNDEIGYTGDVINEMAEGLQERDFIKETFGKYVSEEIRDEILGGRIPLDGEVRRVTVLFADLRDFTPMVEKTEPKKMITVLNGYFREMEEAIREHHGLVLQYIGDEIEAAFGAPIHSEDHAAQAVSAAKEMSRRLDAFNERLAGSGLRLAHGIGIHTGEVLAATIGSPDRLSYALVGDTVNVASRVQDLSKHFGTEIVMTEATQAEIGKRFSLKKLPATPIKGKSGTIQLYAIG